MAATNDQKPLALIVVKHRHGSGGTTNWPFAGRIGIRETHPATGRQEIHVLDHWCYLGKVTREQELDSTAGATSSRLDIDIYKILRRYLDRTGDHEILDLSRH